MTQPNDPVRWLSSVDDAPDVLRAPLLAAQKEGPSEQQMRALAIKLAALSAGTVAATTAASAKAATTAGATTAKVTGTLSATKVVVSLAVMGATASGVVWSLKREPAPDVARPVADAPVVDIASEPVAAPADAEHSHARARDQLTPPAPAAEPDSATAGQALALANEAEETRREPALVGEAEAPNQAPKAQGARRSRAQREPRAQAAQRAPSLKVERVQGKVPSEVELLRRARAALTARPREAFALTEQHREHYPKGTFVQERDALAIEALMRAGDLNMARALAERFVRDYPNSPHAHRFREAMGLR